MKNFVFYIIVVLVACSNFACAGGWQDACPELIDTLIVLGKQFQGYKDYNPSCLEDVKEMLLYADWSCADESRRNLISCQKDFKYNDILGSVKRCTEAYWGFYNDCSEAVVNLYKENEKELKECQEKFTAAFLKWAEAEWDEMITAFQAIDVSKDCWNGIRAHYFKRNCNPYLRRYGMCN